MGVVMELSNETLETIGSYVKRNLPAWLRDAGAPVYRVDPVLLERIVRVEEELRSQREFMQRSFSQAEARAAQVEERFAEQREDLAARFEQVDKRLDDLHRQATRSITVLTVMLAIIGVAVTVASLL